MTPKTTIKVLIVVVLLLMSGGIVSAFIFSSPTVVGSGEDYLSSTVGAGDYYEVNVTSDATSSSPTYLSRSEFFEWIYTVRGDRDVLHTKDITVNGVKVTCDCYYEATLKGKNIYFVDPKAEADHARTYGYEVYEGDELTDSRYLVSTNFPLNKKIDEQTMYLGENMSYITHEPVSSKICPAVSLILECTVTQTVGRYDESQIKWSVSVDTIRHDSDSGTATVAEFVPDDSGGKVILTDENIITKREFMMTLDYMQFLSYIKDSGATMSRGVPEAKTIDTVYGKRDVTEETLTVFGSFNSRYVIDFGSDYVIYSITEMKNGQEGSTVTKVTSSSLIHEGTKEVYGSQFNLSLNSMTLAVFIVVCAGAGAILIGIIAFRMVRRKVES